MVDLQRDDRVPLGAIKGTRDLHQVMQILSRNA